MKKKTIVILSQASTNEQIPYTSYVHNHAIALKNKGYNIIVLASKTFKPGRKYKYSKEQNIDGIRVIYFNRIGFSNLLYKSKINLNAIGYYLGAKKILKKLIKEENVVLLDAHTFKIQGVAASWLKKKFNLKTFITLHGTSFDRNLHFKNGVNSIKKVSSIVDKMVCVSEKIERQLKSLDIKNTKVIYNGIKFSKFSNKKRKHEIATIGTFTPDKNIDIVIESFKEVLKKYPDSHLTIMGDGPYKLKLYELAKPVQDKITFTGYLSNLEVLENLSYTDVFVLASKPEGFGICYAEAMQAGCITIGTKGEGIDGFIKHEENGFLVNIDTLEISNLLTNIFEKKYDLEKIRKKAILSAKKLTWDENANEYINLLNKE